ncbi:MAG TPA: hypothetical protein VFS85_07430 [Dongiaceae bacterium]|nr:hypothetical protein [Dongiaceae bacterium]
MPQQPKIAVLLLALALAACATPPATPPSGTPIALSPATQGELAAYLGKVKVTRPGAFAVSPDGRNSFYTWCSDTACMTSNYSIPALRRCQSLAGTECLVLYVRNQPRFAFSRRVDGRTGRHGSQEQPPLEFD